MKRLNLLLLFLLLTISSAAFALASEVAEYHLANGLKLLVKEDHRAPVASIQIWYKVGSVNESTGLTGISHVLEHLMFQGSQHYAGDAYVKIIAANGGTQNAATNYDYTYYFQKIAADKLPISFQLEADRMQYLIFSDKDFAKEMKVVKEERRMRTDDDPQGITLERFNASAFISSPYHHMPIGWMKDLDGLTVNDAKNWYQTWYAPNNATVVVVGDVNSEKVYQLAQKYFGAIPSKPIPVLKSLADQEPLGERKVIVSVPAKLPGLLIGYNVPTLPNAKTTWEPYALQVLSGVLNAGSSGRLQSNLVRGQQIASEAGNYYDLISKLPNLFVIYATPMPNFSLKQLQHSIQEQINKLSTESITAAELQRVKNALIAERVFSEDSLYVQAQEIGAYESVGLGWQKLDDYTKQIEAITPAQIQTVVKKYFIPDRLVVGYLKPKS